MKSKLRLVSLFAALFLGGATLYSQIAVPAYSTRGFVGTGNQQELITSFVIDAEDDLLLLVTGKGLTLGEGESAAAGAEGLTLTLSDLVANADVATVSAANSWQVAAFGGGQSLATGDVALIGTVSGGAYSAILGAETAGIGLNEVYVLDGLGVAEALTNMGQFSILLDLIEAAGLTATVVDLEDFTLFAPTNAAFAGLLEVLELDTVAELAAALADGALARILTYHLITTAPTGFDDATMALADFALGGSRSYQTAEDGSVFVAAAAGTVNQANIIGTDVFVSGGVIHVIDSVLLPPQPPSLFGGSPE